MGSCKDGVSSVAEEIEAGDLCAEPSAPAEGEPAESRGFYADDVPFRSGVVQLQSPFHMAFIAALNGFNPPRPEGRFRYCDLGCGNGTTLNAFAAIHPEAEFVGIDFNAGHIAQAREQARTAGLSNVRFIRGSFTEVVAEDFPEFDFIGMNGIYSWLDKDILPSVHEFLRRYLKPGGLFYVEYMCMPGMIAIVPVWHLIQALIPDVGDGSRDRATRGLRLLEELYKGGMAYLDRHPTARNAAEGYIKGWSHSENRADHFAHNALASGFRPRFVNEMCEEMADAGLVFGGRTQIALNDPDLAVTLQQASVLHGIEDRTVRELLLDFMRNERNRRDVYVKPGSSEATDIQAARDYLLNEIKLLGRVPAARMRRRIDLPGPRQLSLTGEAYDRLIAAFDGAARTLREADPEGALSDDSLIAAGHRLLTSGQYFLCEPGFSGGPLPDAPERLHVPLAFNRLRLEKAWAEFVGAPLVARSTGGNVMTLGPLEAVLLNAWIEAGRAGAVAEARKRLADVEAKVRVNKKEQAVRDLDETQLDLLIARLERVRVPNLLRLGVLAAA